MNKEFISSLQVSKIQVTSTTKTVQKRTSMTIMVGSEQNFFSSFFCRTRHLRQHAVRHKCSRQDIICETEKSKSQA